jgi:hypothetical protein
VNPDGFDASAGAGEPSADEPGTGGPEDLHGSSDDTDGSAVFDVFEGLVLDEAFVLAALIHEPSAEERLLALRAGARRRGRASLSGSGSQAARTGSPRQAGYGSGSFDGRRGRHQAVPGRWQRVVARVMLVVIGVLAILVAAAAVYRGATPGHQPMQRPSTGTGGSTAASAAAASAQAGVAQAGSVQAGSVRTVTAGR